MNKTIDSTRQGFKNGLMELAEKRDDIVLVSTDSLKVSGGDSFYARWPDRVIELGIAEQNGVAVSAGLAVSGLIPYICTYAGFLTMRACEQMRTFVAYPKLKVRFAGLNGGLSGGNREGVSHQFIEDIGILRTIPGFTILCPADGNQVRQAVLASDTVEGPVYIRLGSGKEEQVFPPETEFPLGKVRIILSYGNDVALFSYGCLLNRTLRAAETLKTQGINATVAEVATIKPLDCRGISAILASTGCAVTIEDHTIIGGLGSAVAELIAEQIPAKLIRLGVQDRYGESGDPEALLDAYGMSVKHIVHAAMKVTERRSII